MADILGELGRVCDALTEEERTRVLTEAMGPYRWNDRERCLRDVACGLPHFGDWDDAQKAIADAFIARTRCAVGCEYDVLCDHHGVATVNAAIRDRILMGENRPAQPVENILRGVGVESGVR